MWLTTKFLASPPQFPVSYLHGPQVGVLGDRRDEPSLERDRVRDVDVLVVLDASAGVVGGVDDGVPLDCYGDGLGEESGEGDALGLGPLVEGLEAGHVDEARDAEDGNGESGLHVRRDGSLRERRRRRRRRRRRGERKMRGENKKIRAGRREKGRRNRRR